MLVMSDFLDPSRGPEQRGGFRVSPTLFLVMVGLGFLLGALGHLVRSRALQAVGVGLIFLSTVLIPITLRATH